MNSNAKPFNVNANNWMNLPFPESKVLSERMLNQSRLFELMGSEVGRGSMKVFSEEAAELENQRRKLVEVMRRAWPQIAAGPQGERVAGEIKGLFAELGEDL